MQRTSRAYGHATSGLNLRQQLCWLVVAALACGLLWRAAGQAGRLRGGEGGGGGGGGEALEYRPWRRAGRAAGWELLEAASHGSVEGVRDTLLRGAPLAARDNMGRTALVLAADRGHTELALELIKLGADVNARDVHAGTPLIYAATGGHDAILTALLAAGARVDTVKISNSDTAFTRAARRDNLAAVTALVAAGSNVDHYDSEGKT